MAFSRPGSLRRSAAAGFAVLGFVLMWGCAGSKRAEPVVEGPLERVPDHRWPQVTDDLDPASFAEACRQGAAYLDGLPSDRSFVFGTESRTAAELADGLRLASEITI